MTALSPNQWTILESLKAGPRWLRSFQWVRPLLADLVAQGFVEHCSPPGCRGNNMARLTARGGGLIGVDIAPVSLIDRLAEAISQHGDIARASDEICISRPHGRMLFDKIRKRLGVQAQ